jgi:hypothetical protein
VIEKTLHVDLRVGESMTIGGAQVRLEEKSGKRARLSITAPPSMRIEPPARRGAADLMARRGVLDARQTT